MLDSLNEYAQLINFTLLVAIIGYLFTLTQAYKAANEKKHEAELAEKQGEINSLKRELHAQKESVKAQISAKDEQIAQLNERVNQQKEQHRIIIDTLEERIKANLEHQKAFEAAQNERLKIRELHSNFQVEMLNIRNTVFQELASLPSDRPEVQRMKEEVETRIVELDEQIKLISDETLKSEIRKEKGMLKRISEQLGTLANDSILSMATLALPIGLAMYQQRVQKDIEAIKDQPS